MPADAAPLLKSFYLVGLHGYKNIRLDFNSKSKIVIAENGAGKTIFLSALQAFLARNFAKLATIQFQRVECELEGLSSSLILHRSYLRTMGEEAQDGLQALANYAKVDTSDVSDAVLLYSGGDIRETPILHRVYANSPWSMEETLDRIRQLQSVLDPAQSDEVKSISSTLKTAFRATDILYLPTYRRIELSISKRENRRLAGRVARCVASMLLTSHLMGTSLYWASIMV